MIRRGAWLGLLCMACVRYQPQPIDPSRHPAEVTKRDLSDSVLVAHVARFAGRPRGNRWTDRQLAVAALELRTRLSRMRAELKAARAAERTAGERPRPGVQTEVERRVGGRNDGDPWVVGLGAMFALELGGKRGARLQAARARVALAEGRLLAEAWEAVGETRRAAVLLAQAEAEVEERRQEIARLEGVHRLERARYAEAALGASDLARTSAEIQDARLAWAHSSRTALEARAVLAGALTVPLRAAEGVEPTIVPPVRCLSPDVPAGDSLVPRAMERRYEIALALGEYALSEAEVRLQVARQYPDLELGPGFIWDQGVNRWTLALALPALLGSRNRGAIREAEAAREVAGLRVAEVQDSVLADLAASVQACRGAGLELMAADSVVAAAQRLADRDQAAYDRGETSSLEPARSELLLLRAQQARRRAERGSVLASLDLERSIGGPAPGTADPWPDPREGVQQEELSP